MPITVKLDKKRLEQIAHDLGTNADRIVGQIAFDIEADAKASFGTGPEGRSYKRGSVTHVASAPLGPPAVDTGALRASVTAEKISEAKWQVGDGVDYGASLEFGTPFVAPRPWLGPAVFRVRQKFAERFKGLFK